MNKFDLKKSIEILEKTPSVINSLLGGLSDSWINSKYGEDTWSSFDIVGHFIHGEKTDWIPRAKTILNYGEGKPFVPFDRFAQFTDSKNKTLKDLLDEFLNLRSQNINLLKNMNLSEQDLDKTGTHPELGKVTLRQLIATWVIHDLNHISQIVRAMAANYKEETGPWGEYLPILNK